MLSPENIAKFWLTLEAGNSPPKYVKNVDILDFEEIKRAVDGGNEAYIKKIIENMYDGDAYILRGAARKSLKKTMLELAKYYDQCSGSSFQKMLDGTPNFHRVIDADITKKYSLYAIKHSYYLYNWNIRSELEKEFKDEVYRHWRYIKYLAGNEMNQYENNIPSDNQIDRLQIVNYPHGGGELRDHEDPRKNQRIVSGLIMSKIGEDFQHGGFYFRDCNNEKFNLEQQLEIGDSVMFYGSIIHGVEPVDPNKNIDWGSYEGRWFIGMFVNDSDHVANRTTAKDLTNSVEFLKN
jgi:hypothetical protein